HGAETERGSTDSGATARDDRRVRANASVHLQRVHSLSHVRKDEVERVRAGGLENEVDRRREVAGAANAVDEHRARGDVLGQGLNSTVKNNAPVVRLLGAARASSAAPRSRTKIGRAHV